MPHERRRSHPPHGRRQQDPPTRESRLDALLQQLRGVVSARHPNHRGLHLRLLQQVHHRVQQRLLGSVREQVKLFQHEDHAASPVLQHPEHLAHERHVLGEAGGPAELELLRLEPEAQLLGNLPHRDALIRVKHPVETYGEDAVAVSLAELSQRGVQHQSLAAAPGAHEQHGVVLPARDRVGEDVGEVPLMLAKLGAKIKRGFSRRGVAGRREETPAEVPHGGVSRARVHDDDARILRGVRGGFRRLYRSLVVGGCFSGGVFVFPRRRERRSESRGDPTRNVEGRHHALVPRDVRPARSLERGEAVVRGGRRGAATFTRVDRAASVFSVVVVGRGLRRGDVPFGVVPVVDVASGVDRLGRRRRFPLVAVSSSRRRPRRRESFFFFFFSTPGLDGVAHGRGQVPGRRGLVPDDARRLRLREVHHVLGAPEPLAVG